MGVVKSKVILFKNTRTKDEIVNGMGDFILDNICLSCTTEENLETSEYLLDAEFLIDKDGLFDNLEEDTVLKVLLDYGYEYFSIANVTKTLDTIIVVARQITITETLSMWCDDVRPESKNGQDALQHIVDNSIGNKNITVSSDIPTIATSYFINKTVYEAIHSNDNAFLTRWGGEVQRRQFNITINRKIGEDNGIQIRSRKNLTGFEAETNIDNVVTRIKPIGFDGITIDGYVDSEIIDNYKYVRTKRVEYSNVKVRTENTGENEEVFETLEEAQNELRRLALMEYADGKVDVLRADYTIKFIDLSQTEEYKEYSQIETVNIGDEIQVIEDKLNINIIVRAIQRTYDVLDSRVIEIKLSNQAKIENQNNVEALKSRLDELTENVGYMNVTFAKIKDLEATNATIENLEATKIDVEELNAVKADIVALNADFAEIDTLVNGHLTSDNIQSMIITGDKFTVEDAFIKDAMIDTVNASKINTGVLNTNNVQIQSEDGSMLLQGNLQQFKDSEGTVRIQIGKDANGDFTFCLFSQDGVGILLDEEGIHAGAVPDGLIVNDMVADNANIQGSKLDINSVITSINNGTTTINSNRIYLDEEGQSLQIAFDQLKTKVETIEEVTVDGDLSSVIEQVTSNTSNINIMQGEISSLISNTTITKENGEVVQLKDEYNSTKNTVDSHSTKIGSLETTVNDVTSKQASMELDLNGFRTEVSNAYATKDELEENTSSLVTKTEFEQTTEDFTFKISQTGGYNLVKNSAGAGGTALWTPWRLEEFDTYIISDTNVSPTGKCFYIRNTSTSSNEGYVYSPRFALKPNTTYRFSIVLNTQLNVVSADVFVLASDSIDVGSEDYYTYSEAHHVVPGYHTGGNWQYITKTFTTGDNIKSGYVRVDHNGMQYETDSYVYIYWASLMVKEGELEVPWRPHPSEIYDGIVKIDVEGIKVEHADTDTYTTMTAKGFTSTHADGSFTMLNEDGLIRCVGNDFHNYHYLTAVGVIILQGGERYEPISVILPSSFDHVDEYRLRFANMSWSLERESNISNPDYFISSMDLPSGGDVYWYKNSDGHWQNDNFTAHVQIWDAYQYYTYNTKWSDCFEYSSARLSYIITV